MIDTAKNHILPREFYIRPVITVARELLGKVIVKNENGITLSGRIVEVEAYNGETDEAAHSFNGKTKRNEVMFNEGGYFYVYFTYGAHYCCNIVTGKIGKGTAVLIRAVEPLSGIEIMINNRFKRKLKNEKEIINLTSGPGKICEAFGFNKEHSGLDLTKNFVYLIDQKKLERNKIGISKRIGITKSVDLPWRFFEIGNPFLSR
jgi:DNA-3-methyladenine glycosylase